MSPGRRFTGQGVAPGIAIGPAYLWPRRGQTGGAGAAAGSRRGEVERLSAAAAVARERTREIVRQAGRTLTRAEVGIFEAQLLMLDDPNLVGRAEEVIRTGRLSAEEALERAGAECAAALRAVPDESWRARTSDVADVVGRVLDALADRPAPSLPSFDHPVLVVAEELLPSDIVALDREKVLGFVTQTGSPTSHASVLARSLGLPAVAGVPSVCDLIREGDVVAADGASGEVVVGPDPVEAEDWRARQAVRREWRDAFRSRAHLPAITTDGHRIRVAANIGTPDEAQTAFTNGADGIGLFRTEVFFMGRASLPGEDEQCGVYGEVIRRLAPRPVVIRTLDARGDKPVSLVSSGGRAVRHAGGRSSQLALGHEDVFLAQLRAVLRAAAGAGEDGRAGVRRPGEAEVSVLFPMVANLADVLAAKALLARAAAELDARGVARGEVKVGLMIEVPSAVALIGLLLREVDFVSLGTNDLARLTSGPTDVPVPTVLRLVAAVADAARRAGKPVTVCGELAADPRAIPLLVGLGVGELSVAPLLVPEVKQVVRTVSRREAASLAKRLLTARPAEGATGDG